MALKCAGVFYQHDISALEYSIYSAWEHRLFMGIPDLLKLSQNKTHADAETDCGFVGFV